MGSRRYDGTDSMPVYLYRLHLEVQSELTDGLDLRKDVPSSPKATPGQDEDEVEVQQKLDATSNGEDVNCSC